MLLLNCLVQDTRAIILTPRSNEHAAEEPADPESQYQNTRTLEKNTRIPEKESSEINGPGERRMAENQELNTRNRVFKMKIATTNE